MGDKVIMHIGGGERHGVVIEDRGKLDLGGRQIVVVRVDSENKGRQFEGSSRRPRTRSGVTDASPGDICETINPAF
jgi:hypothetical protein